MARRCHASDALRRAPLSGALHALLIFCAAACHHERPHSPEAAFRVLARAVADRDPDSLYKSLDERTRNSIETACDYEHQMASLVSSSYPAGPDRDAALRQYDDALRADSGHALFVNEASAHDPYAPLAPVASGFQRLIMDPPDPQDPGARATVLTQDGARLPFAENKDGTWGYAGLADAWQARVVRDSHDDAIISDNVRLFHGGTTSAPAAASAPSSAPSPAGARP